MAGALRPAVFLIVLASILFLASGALDTVHAVSDFASVESYALGVVNLLVVVLIARGSERMLALRIGLAAFFVVERPVTAVAFDPQPVDVVGVHLATSVVEAVILVSTLRLWRLGHGVTERDMRLLTAPPAALPANPAAAPEAPTPAPSGGWGIGLLAFLLAGALVADAVLRGALPGTAVDPASPAALGYVFALVVLVVAARAVHGRRLPLRLLVVVSLITFVERAFTPFVLGAAGLVSLALHAAAAVISLALAAASAGALRAGRRAAAAPVP